MGVSPPGWPHYLFILQLEQLCSWQSLLTHLSASDLPMSLGGSLPYCHQAWLEFRMVSELWGQMVNHRQLGLQLHVLGVWSSAGLAAVPRR